MAQFPAIGSRYPATSFFGRSAQCAGSAEQDIPDQPGQLQNGRICGCGGFTCVHLRWEAGAKEVSSTGDVLPPSDVTPWLLKLPRPLGHCYVAKCRTHDFSSTDSAHMSAWVSSVKVHQLFIENKFDDDIVTTGVPWSHLSFGLHWIFFTWALWKG